MWHSQPRAHCKGRCYVLRAYRRRLYELNRSQPACPKKKKKKESRAVLISKSSVCKKKKCKSSVCGVVPALPVLNGKKGRMSGAIKGLQRSSTVQLYIYSYSSSCSSYLFSEANQTKKKETKKEYQIKTTLIRVYCMAGTCFKAGVYCMARTTSKQG